jgi:hypothetical protein
VTYINFLFKPMSDDRSTMLRQFIDWFKSNGAFFDHKSLSLGEIPGQGHGAIALRDLSV